jgi:hypothetical protein
MNQVFSNDCADGYLCLKLRNDFIAGTRRYAKVLFTYLAQMQEDIGSQNVGVIAHRQNKKRQPSNY